MKSCISMIILIALLSSCGQKGALFLPSDPARQKDLLRYEPWRTEAQQQKQREQEQQQTQDNSGDVQ